MLITYYVEDGYAGSRPKHLIIDDDELAELETEQEKHEYIENAIQQHFEENISWSCDIQKYLLQSKV